MDLTLVSAVRRLVESASLILGATAQGAQLLAAGMAALSAIVGVLLGGILTLVIQLISAWQEETRRLRERNEQRFGAIVDRLVMPLLGVTALARAERSDRVGLATKTQLLDALARGIAFSTELPPQVRQRLMSLHARLIGLDLAGLQATDLRAEELIQIEEDLLQLLVGYYGPMGVRQ